AVGRRKRPDFLGRRIAKSVLSRKLLPSPEIPTTYPGWHPGCATRRLARRRFASGAGPAPPARRPPWLRQLAGLGLPRVPLPAHRVGRPAALGAPPLVPAPRALGLRPPRTPARDDPEPPPGRLRSRRLPARLRRLAACGAGRPDLGGRGR